MRYRRRIRNGSWAYRSKAASRSVHRSVGMLFLALTCTRFANVEQTGRKKRNSRRSSASIPCFSPLSSIIDRYFSWFSADNQRELKKKKHRETWKHMLRVMETTEWISLSILVPENENRYCLESSFTVSQLCFQSNIIWTMFSLPLLEFLYSRFHCFFFFSLSFLVELLVRGIFLGVFMVTKMIIASLNNWNETWFWFMSCKRISKVSQYKIIYARKKSRIKKWKIIKIFVC